MKRIETHDLKSWGSWEIMPHMCVKVDQKSCFISNQGKKRIPVKFHPHLAIVLAFKG